MVLRAMGFNMYEIKLDQYSSVCTELSFKYIKDFNIKSDPENFRGKGEHSSTNRHGVNLSEENSNNTEKKVRTSTKKWDLMNLKR